MTRLLMLPAGHRVKLILLLCLLLGLNNFIHQKYLWGYNWDSTIEMVHWKDENSSSKRIRRDSEDGDACLLHKPIRVYNVVRNPRMHRSSLSTEEDTIGEILQQSSPDKCGLLKRTFWKDGYTVISILAKEIERHQTNCSLAPMIYHLDDLYGIGAHLHLWSQAMCNSHELNFRIRTYNPNWIWSDRAYCQKGTYKSPFSCYFPKMEDRCAQDSLHDSIIYQQRNVSSPLKARERCERMQKQYYLNDTLQQQFVSEYRAASTEYTFQHISPIVVQEAERQIGLLFPKVTSVNEEVVAPNDLISVHLRWGDKFFEMKLVSIEEYIRSISYMLIKVMGRPNDHTANIYLSTEDPMAVEEFLQKVPHKGWNVYVDRSVTELNPFRPMKGNRASWTTRNTNGRAGLVALGSLLVSMEANYYILTTGSNWSRLMNELRKNVLDPRCNNCTRMIDLRAGEW